MPAVACAPIASSFVQRPKIARSRPIETAPQHGEKPFAQLVDEAFDGPVLRLSQKLRLLEEAKNRDIRRGDALDLIATTQRRLDEKHFVRRPTMKRRFACHFAAFAMLYVMVAVAWCAVVSL